MIFARYFQALSETAWGIWTGWIFEQSRFPRADPWGTNLPQMYPERDWYYMYIYIYCSFAQIGPREARHVLFDSVIHEIA